MPYWFVHVCASLTVARKYVTHSLLEHTSATLGTDIIEATHCYKTTGTEVNVGTHCWNNGNIGGTRGYLVGYCHHYSIINKVYLSINNSDYKALNDRTKCAAYETKWQWSNLRYYLGISLEGLRKTTKCLNRNSWSLGRDWDVDSLDYEAGCLVVTYNSPVLGCGMTSGFFSSLSPLSVPPGSSLLMGLLLPFSPPDPPPPEPVTLCSWAAALCRFRRPSLREHWSRSTTPTTTNKTNSAATTPISMFIMGVKRNPGRGRSVKQKP
jgi:hypothetical protein